MCIKNTYPDKAYKTIHFELKNFPGVVAISERKPVFSYHHKFDIVLPREYPQNLSQIKIVNLTDLYHPRISAIGTKACYAVNGEVDRILVDIIYNVLMRPETVRAPNQFKDADWGLDANKMKWYIVYGPQKLHEELLELWQKKWKTKKRNIQILD